jgi:hypothetical protein
MLYAVTQDISYVTTLETYLSKERLCELYLSVPEQEMQESFCNCDNEMFCFLQGWEPF